MPHAKVDRAAGIIPNVRICGLVSENGYRYSEDCLRNAASLYEGVKVYLDHTEAHDLHRDRKLTEAFGRLLNVRYVSGRGLFGDLQYVRSHPQAAQIVEIAESMPEQIGLSHHADGRIRDDEVVDRIVQVYSVDLVTSPATTAGLFESTGTRYRGLRPLFESDPLFNVEDGAPFHELEQAMLKEKLINIIKDVSTDPAAKIAAIEALLDEDDAAAAPEAEFGDAADVMTTESRRRHRASLRQYPAGGSKAFARACRN